MAPETRCARSGELHIAYQVVGEGSMDLVFVPSWISQVEHYWEEPTVARYFNRLASFSRLIMFDRRGSGLSDPVLRAPTLEEQMDDVVAVMDTAGSERATVFAQLEGGAMAALGALAGPGEVLVSGTVRDLVVGSGISFEDRGERELKGVPGLWRLWAAAT
jgi:pimeloyl-ACP methyl ester carboxylesterase